MFYPYYYYMYIRYPSTIHKLYYYIRLITWYHGSFIALEFFGTTVTTTRGTAREVEGSPETDLSIGKWW